MLSSFLTRAHPPSPFARRQAQPRPTTPLNMASQSTSVSASPGPSTKRQRTSSPSAPAAVPTRSERWWLADGNVILQAESTVFKVHKSVVSRAEVLKDTLDVGSVMAQETNGRGMSDGEELPTISLHDRAKDVDVLLRAIYDGM